MKEEEIYINSKVETKRDECDGMKPNLLEKTIRFEECNLSNLPRRNSPLTTSTPSAKLYFG